MIFVAPVLFFLLGFGCRSVVGIPGELGGVFVTGSSRGRLVASGLLTTETFLGLYLQQSCDVGHFSFFFL